MKNLMIDLETMGNSSNAAIVSIGACFFEPSTGEIGEKFSRIISLESFSSMWLYRCQYSALVDEAKQ
ncbi:3'-5' exoribonuclease domain-containing protein [Vibrio sp. TBV020]|uniref:3'-5' exoribonuclease domain-containing protein n=1 Tax=Vibrio sp. TBV020 TaxID=3137398 RepID=UPI0038CD741D